MHTLTLWLQDKNERFYAILLYAINLICLLLISIIIYANQALFMNHDTYMYMLQAIYPILMISLVVHFSNLKKQALSTIGIGKDGFWKSLAIGIFISVIIFMILSGREINIDALLNRNLLPILLRILYYFVFIAFTEELVFRSYIGRKIDIKNERISLLLVGVLFACSHIPFDLIMNRFDISSYFFIIICHVLFQWFYNKYNNLIGPVLVHFTIDFVPWLLVFLK